MKKIIYIIIVAVILIGGGMLFFKGNDVSYETEVGDETQVIDNGTGQESNNEEDGVSGSTGLEGEECDIDETYGVCGVEIGRSVEDRSIKAFTIGEGEKTVLLIGGIHTGIARNSSDLTSAILKHYIGDTDSVPENTRMVIVPLVNPDGIANETRTNTNGVDLNRNWPTDDWKGDPYHPQEGTLSGAGGTNSLSEPETKALSTYITQLEPDIVIMYYSQAGSIEDNDVGIADELGSLYAEASGYEHIDEWTFYEVTGDLLTSLKEESVPAMEIVLSSREIEFAQNIKGVQSILTYFGGMK